MGYRLERSETPHQGLRRIVRDQVHAARKSLDHPDDPHEAIHDARKCFKKIRAALRLARGPLKKIYKQENACYRDLGQKLSRLRDAEAMIETIDRLAEDYGDQAQPRVFENVRNELIARRDRIAEEDVDLAEKLQDVVATLDKAELRIADWPKLPQTFSAFAPGLHRTYRRGRKGLKHAPQQPTDENYHEWRKRVKYLWYHVRLLQDTWPQVMKALRASLKDLARALGHDHDLAVLRETLRQNPEAFGYEQDLQALMGLIDRGQQTLRSRAEKIGLHVYAEAADDFVDRIEAYWQAWHEPNRPLSPPDLVNDD